METQTMKRRIAHTFIIGLLAFVPLAANADTSTAAEAGTLGSALPPGVNPSTPSGGNGGDAGGYQPTPKTGNTANTGKTTDSHGNVKHQGSKHPSVKQPSIKQPSDKPVSKPKTE
jgi:hypothetical protein